MGSILGLSLVVATALASATKEASAQGTGSGKPTIVLVHGAFADASGWHDVIQRLQKDGYPVFAVQNHMASLAEDIVTTKRAIDAQKGSVVVVGHSYGGAVITGAAANNPNVTALVYLAAFAPEVGETLKALGDHAGPAPLASALVPDAAGFLFVDRAKFHDVFCADLAPGEASIMSVSQKPLAASAFGESVSAAAWKTVPSWFLVSQDDRAINPELERFMAKRMGAKTSEIKSSHVAFISHSAEVTQVIEQAAKGGRAVTK